MISGRCGSIAPSELSEKSWLLSLLRGDATLQDRSEDTSDFLAIEELFGKRNERLGTIRRLFLSSSHMVVITALSGLVAEDQLTVLP